MSFFDIDANGILNVSAEDKTTGAVAAALCRPPLIACYGVPNFRVEGCLGWRMDIQRVNACVSCSHLIALTCVLRTHSARIARSA